MGDGVTALDRLSGDVPDWLDQDAWARIKLNLEGPGAREHWKHSSLTKTLDALVGTERSVNEDLGDLPNGVETLRFSEADTATLEVIRQRLAHRMDWSRYPLADVVNLIARDGWLIRVRRSLDAPLIIEAPGGINSPVIIEIAPGAEVELREVSHATGVQARLITIVIGRDAKLVHARHEFVSDCEHWQLLRVTLDDDASYQLHSHVVGARLRRIDCQILLEGNGATAELTGTGITDDGTHLDQRHVVEHIGRATTSRNKLHNIAKGKSRCTFNGRIHIHAGASGTDADLQNKNLALHESSEINTKPELEIYDDDVKCAHGATVGQLDEQALFYLGSRGIEPSLAKRLLCIGFITECIDGPLADELRGELLRHVDS